MKKQVIRLTETDLHNVIKESVDKVLNETQLNELGGYSPNAGYVFKMQETYRILMKEYEKWKPAEYSIHGMDKILDSMSTTINVMRSFLRDCGV